MIEPMLEVPLGGPETAITKAPDWALEKLVAGGRHLRVMDGSSPQRVSITQSIAAAILRERNSA